MPDDWRAGLPAELKDHASLKDVKDVGGLAKQFVDTLSAQGQMIRIPGPDAGDDARAAFHTKLSDKVPGLIPTPDPENADQMNALFKKMGRPDDPAGYEHPEGVDATRMAEFATLAHGLGLSKGQYAKLVGSINEYTTKQTEAASEAFLAAQRALKQKWGIVYEDNLQLVDQVMKGTGAPKEMLEMAADGKMPPEAAEWLFNIGKQLGAEGVNFNKDEFSTRVTPQEAQDRINDIMNDTKGPYWDGSHPEHKAYVDKVVDLRRAMAAGGK